MRTIEITEIGKYLDGTKGTNINLMFVGDTGIGKTQAIQKYCRDNGTYLKILNLARLEATEALGIPVHSTREFDGKTYDVINQAIPSWVFDLKEHEDNAMLFLDEFLCAEPGVMNSFLTFITDKEVSGITLKKITIVAATNVGMYTFEPDANILSRFCMMYTINSSYGRYINSKAKTPIINDYKDENVQANNVIFDERSLKPRCMESLSMLTDFDIIQACFEGFTNRGYEVYSSIPKVNTIIANTKGMTNNDAIRTIGSALIASYPRVKIWDNSTKIYNSFVDKDLADDVFNYINNSIGDDF